MKRNNGFTLIEILVVILVTGILLSIIFVTVGGELKKSKLRVATSKIFELVEQARNDSIKTSKDQTLTWTTTTFQAGTHPAVTLDGVTITNTPEQLKYRAPYGDFSGAGGYRLDIQDASGTYHTAIDMVGVTGSPRRSSTEKVGVDVK